MHFILLVQRGSEYHKILWCTNSFSTVFKYLPFWMLFLANLSKPTGYVMHQQFNIQQLYALPTLYLCVLYLKVFTARYGLGL
jgi:hypothetical protein